MKEESDTPEDVDGIISKPPRIRELRQALGRLRQAHRKVKHN
jgi:hypothetical protein